MEEIYSGGGITLYVVKLENNHLLIYENGDNSLIECDEQYEFGIGKDDEKHLFKDYIINSDEYNDLIEKHFKNVYKK